MRVCDRQEWGCAARVGPYDSGAQTCVRVGTYDSGAQTCADGGSTYRNAGMKSDGAGVFISRCIISFSQGLPRDSVRKI